MTTVDEDEAVDTIAKGPDSTWDIACLKKEVSRLTLRSLKKLGKANTKLTQAREVVERLMTDPSTTLENLEQCPNIEAVELELRELQERHQKLIQLEGLLHSEKKRSGLLPVQVVDLAVELGVSDEPPRPPQRGPGKQKGPRESTSKRLPYRRYFCIDKTEIRVGKKAEDNDQLSCSPQHRDGADWWMHAAGCPGSHIVIRCHDDILKEDVVQDAAALAARQSKCAGSVIKVSLTRCRDVKKPPGAKAGLVQLTGKVRTVTVNMKEAEARLARLDDTCLIN